MFTERTVHPDVRTLLMAGTPFQYAHLIKFERPSRPEDASGVISTSAQRYTYLTDASRNVDFDDLSTDYNGTANGSQVYIANKVLQVSGMQESIEAKASTFTVTLDGNGIGASVSATGATITAVGDGIHWDIVFPSTVDPLASGFREGDKVTISGFTSGDVNIEAFRANNTIRVKKIDAAIGTGTGTVTLSLSSEEIKAILLNKLSTTYASFINREVYVYRAYFVDGAMIGATPVNGVTGPLLIFKGIISAVSFDEDESGIKVQWSLTSHWGDFAQVKGRITSDDFHRALDETGRPQPYSAIKPVYAFDKGFIHAETSINLLTDYTVQVEKQKIKSKSGFLGLGIGAKVKVKKYYVNETHHSNLDFQLVAKSIPVVYGVRSLEGIPVFADTLLNDASKVYVIHALSEGEIGGIYDIYVDGKSSICSNQSDYDVRHAQNTNNTVDVICTGRADRGDVLQGTTSIGSTVSTFYTPVTTTSTGYDAQDLARNVYSLYQNLNYHVTYRDYVAPTDVAASTTSGGITNGRSIKLTTQQNIVLDFFSGTESQIASPALVAIAAAKNFKVQNDYWIGGGAAEYWGPNHRLLDTAYVVAAYKIAEGETTIPSLEFVIRGKGLNCYNYDYSYTHDDKVGTESAANFKLGQTVTLRRSSDNAVLVSNVQIIDKWTIVRPDGQPDTRFRWSTNPDLALDAEGKPTITRFYMTDGTNNWTMITHNYELNSGDVPATLSTPITSVGPAAPTSGGTDIVVPTTPWLTIGGVGGVTPAVSIYATSSDTNNEVLIGTARSSTTRFNTFFAQ